MKTKILYTLWIFLFICPLINAQSVTPYACNSVISSVTSLSVGTNNTIYIVAGTAVYSHNPFTGCTNLQFPEPGYSFWTSSFYNGALYVGGMGSSGFSDTTSIYKYSNGAWSVAGFIPAGIIRCMTVFNNELYVGGEFQSSNGINAINITKFNGTAWSTVGGSLASLLEVRSMTDFNNSLYAAGRELSNDIKIFKLNAGTWIPSSIVSNNGSFAIVDAMTEFNGDLVIAGIFSHVNGVASSNISRFNGTTWSAFGAGLTGGPGRVSALGIYTNKLYAGGGFTESGLNTLNNIAEWNGSGWTDVGGGLPNGSIISMKSFLGSLICGGNFTIPATGLESSLAKVSNCNSNVSVTGSTTICSGLTKTITASSGTNYQWYKNGVLIPGATGNSYNASSAGSYICFITTACGITVSNTITINVNPLPNANISAIGSTTFCVGGNVQLSVSPGANNSYQWKKYSNNVAGANGLNYTVTTAGKFKCVVTSPAGCSKSSNVIEVFVNPLPTATITASGPTTFCNGGSVVLNANTGSGLTYQWKKYANNIVGAVNASYTAAVAGKYKCVVTNANGCSKGSNAITVSVPCRVAGMSEKTFSMYPNPANDFLNVQIENSETNPLHFEIRDMSGKVVLDAELYEEVSEIDIHNIAPGIYITTIYNQNVNFVQKLVIN